MRNYSKFKRKSDLREKLRDIIRTPKSEIWPPSRIHEPSEALESVPILKEDDNISL